jgi:hypothetical protein
MAFAVAIRRNAFSSMFLGMPCIAGDDELNVLAELNFISAMDVF